MFSPESLFSWRNKSSRSSFIQRSFLFNYWSS